VDVVAVNFALGNLMPPFLPLFLFSSSAILAVCMSLYFS
jgi:hypothetical protein